jgi:hypothetical protein
VSLLEAGVIVVGGGIGLIAAVLLIYYAISFVVLSLVSKLFSLTGRRRSRRT